MKIKKLSQEQFLKSFKFAPRAALNLIITNKAGEILLTKRTKPPFQDMWHFPGSFLLIGERLNDCLARIAQDELGITIDMVKVKLLGVYEDIDKDPRGHVLDIMYGYDINNINITSTKDSKEIRFFDKLPDNIGFNHRETLENLGFK